MARDLEAVSRYRSLEGLIRRFATLGLTPSTTSADYTTLWHRLHHLTPAVKLPKFTDLQLATDDSGLKTGNAGEYRIFRYGDPEAKRRKHLIVVITADVRRKKLIGIEVYIEGVGHSEAEVAQRHLRAAVAQGHHVRKFDGDGAFDSRSMFRSLQEMAIEPVIKIARNSATCRRHSPHPGGWPRRKAVREFRKRGYRAWADTKGYGMRWPGTEGTFSAVKRKFGENTVARSPGGLRAEGYQRFWAYEELREYGETHAPPPTPSRNPM